MGTEAPYSGRCRNFDKLPLTHTCSMALLSGMTPTKPLSHQNSFPLSNATLLPEPDAAASIHLNMAIEKRLLQGKAFLSNVSTQYWNKDPKHDQMCRHAVLLYCAPSAAQYLQRVIPEQIILMLCWRAVHVRRLEAFHIASRGVQTPGSFSPACTHAKNSRCQ